MHEGVCYRRASMFPDPFSPLGLWWTRVSSVRSRNLPPFARDGYYRPFATRVSRQIARQGADVIHVHNLSHFIPILRRHNPGARIVLHMHCEWLTQLPAALVLERIRRADAIVGCSDAISDAVARSYPELAGRVGTLHNGVDTRRFAPPAEDSPHDATRGAVILFVGRITPEKGIHHLMDAFHEIARRHPNSVLRIVGPDSSTPRQFLVELSDDPLVRSLGPFYEAGYADHLSERANREFPGRVEFLGHVRHDDLPDVYRGAHILVNPSLSEAFGIGLIEAAACGLPVVACDYGGMPEAVRDGETGLLVKRADVEGLTEAILRLLENEDLRRALGRRGAEWVSERFGWERIVADTLSLYERLGER
jgi:spore coat protein SA